MSRLRNRQNVAEGTVALSLEKPAGFQFKAGQTIDVKLVDPPETDGEGNTRTFTLASAPYEENLMVATRIRDTAFKRVVTTMSPGAPVTFEGPYGDLTLSAASKRPAVFLAGGIGVTPFRSIVLDANHNKVQRPMFLFYSNRRPEEAAFLAEFRRLQEENPNFTLIATMTQVERSQQDWEGATGYIDGKMLANSIGNLTGPIYYVAGPPGMVTALRKMLNDAGVSDEDIRSEEFSGY